MHVGITTLRYDVNEDSVTMIFHLFGARAPVVCRLLFCRVLAGGSSSSCNSASTYARQPLSARPSSSTRSCKTLTDLYVLSSRMIASPIRCYCGTQLRLRPIRSGLFNRLACHTGDDRPGTRAKHWPSVIDNGQSGVECCAFCCAA